MKEIIAWAVVDSLGRLVCHENRVMIYQKRTEAVFNCYQTCKIIKVRISEVKK